MGIQVYFKGGNTIRKLLLVPKDMITSNTKVNIGTSVTV